MNKSHTTPGNRLRSALTLENPLQIAGTINALCARLANKAGFNAIYLSGAGVANASFGLPDLAMTSLKNVIEDTTRITAISPLPLLVDADTGWKNPGNTTVELIKAGAAGLHIEDQIESKRCGHRPGKVLVSTNEMQDRIKSAVDARTDSSFVIMARTDANAVEGLQSAIDRAHQYIDAGADWIFAEALENLEAYEQFVKSLSVPILANITEFGKTPLLTVDELAKSGVKIILYPLTAFRAMNTAALDTYQTVRQHKTQKSIVDRLQTREELYELLDYYDHEKKLNEKLK